MDIVNKWRSNADKLLSAPVVRRRSISSIAGRVEDRFESIVAARKRGMAWKDIAAAMENGDSVKVDAVESAFKRICTERGTPLPSRTRIQRVVSPVSKSSDEQAPRASHDDLFSGAGERWVDDGE